MVGAASLASTQRCRRPNRRRAWPVVLVLAGLCFKASIRGDGIGYYAYLPAVAGNRSLDMQPTFDRFLERQACPPGRPTSRSGSRTG